MKNHHYSPHVALCSEDKFRVHDIERVRFDVKEAGTGMNEYHLLTIQLSTQDYNMYGKVTLQFSYS